MLGHFCFGLGIEYGLWGLNFFISIKRVGIAENTDRIFMQMGRIENLPRCLSFKLFGDGHSQRIEQEWCNV